MKGKIGVMFLNGWKNRCLVDIRITGRPVLVPGDCNKEEKAQGDLFPPAAISLASSCTCEVLGKALGETSPLAIDFRAYSASLERLRAISGTPDHFHLAQILAAELMYTFLAGDGSAEAIPRETLECTVNNRDELCDFLSESFETELAEKRGTILDLFTDVKLRVRNPLLDRALSLEKDGHLDNCETLLGSIDTRSLDSRDRGIWSVLHLKIQTRKDISNEGCRKNRELLDYLLRENEPEPEVCRELVFTWVRYCQNRRDFSSARRVLHDFMEDYPLSGLSRQERSIFDYFRGREEYHRGEYVGALELLDRSFSLADENDREFLSDIFNTAASCFTDNLLFQHAEILLAEALEIREELHLAKRAESLSAMGCCALKKADFHSALELFEASRNVSRETGFMEDENRILNYLAKTCIFMDDASFASVFLEEAEKKAVTGKQRSFSEALRMALLVRTGKYAEADRYFLEKFILPTDARDLFAVGWAYFHEAQASEKLGRSKDSLKYLSRGISIFLSDNYILESSIVSLAPYAWGMSGENLEFYNRLIADMDLPGRLMDYGEAHSHLPDHFFCPFFRKKLKGFPELEGQLQPFIRGIIHATLTEDGQEAAKLLDSYCFN